MRDGLALYGLPHLSTDDMAVARIDMGECAFHEIAAYFAGQWAEDRHEHLMALRGAMRELRGKSVILTVDANARSTT